MHATVNAAELAFAAAVRSTCGIMDATRRYGPLPKDSSRLKRKCRLLQSWYRFERLREPDCGPWREGQRPVGSTLVDGERTGSNFLSPAAFACAQEKVAEKATNPDLTLDAYRLFNNMLSSMPMCFNLFADLREGVNAGFPAAWRVLAAIFAESPIAAVDAVEVEMLPRPTERYIDDKTAFDAAVTFRDVSGPAGIATIETKYTDRLGGNRAGREERKFALARELDLFTPDGAAWHREHGFDQVARNLLLTLAYAHVEGLAHATNYVLGPAEDGEAPRAVQSLRGRLAPAFRDAILWLPLEQAVERGLAAADGFFADHLERFRARYLDFGQVEHLLRAMEGG